MTKHISPIAFGMGKRYQNRERPAYNQGEHEHVPYAFPMFLAFHVNTVLQKPRTELHGSGTVKMEGCGMDMGFSLVYELAHCLFRDGYALRHEWL